VSAGQTTVQAEREGKCFFSNDFPLCSFLPVQKFVGAWGSISDALPEGRSLADVDGRNVCAVPIKCLRVGVERSLA
jgi:hypothetical protein